MIPHSRPRFDQRYIDRLSEVVDSGTTAMGPEVRKLEQRVVQRIGKDEGVAVDSGTSAIMLALRALLEESNSCKVGIPAYCCSSVLYAARAAGCDPVLMDCGIDLRLTDQALDQAATLDAVILVHPFGMIEPMAAADWPCPVIEDIAQSAGASHMGRPVGSFGNVSVASFYATKPWGGAYGGLVAGNDQRWLTSIRSMCDPDGATSLQRYAGHHQLSDLHAAMALERLERADNEMAARARIADRMDGWFEGDVRPVAGRSDGNSYRYIIRTDGSAEQWISSLNRMGVAASRPVKQTLSRLLGSELSGAEQAWRDCVSIPLLADSDGQELETIRRGVRACIG